MKQPERVEVRIKVTNKSRSDDIMTHLFNYVDCNLSCADDAEEFCLRKFYAVSEF